MRLSNRFGQINSNENSLQTKEEEFCLALAESKKTKFFIKEPETYYQENHVKAIKLLEEGINPNFEHEGKSLLQIAIEIGNYEVADLLIKKGADIEFKLQFDNSPIIYQALLWGKREIAELLISQGVNVLYCDNNGDTLLHIACKRCCSIPILNALLEKGLNINVLNNEQKNLIDLVIEYQSHKDSAEEIVLYLLSKGLLINKANGQEYLAWATGKKGGKPLVEYLLDQGLDINGDKLPIHTAISRENIEIVDLLLSRGADIALKDSQGNTALHLLSFTGHSFGKDEEEYKQITLFNTLIDNGAEVVLDSVNNQGYTPLYQAILNYNNKIAELLILKGVNVLYRDVEGNTLLHKAVNSSSVKIIKLLFEKGVDINAVNHNGQNAIDAIVNAEGIGHSNYASRNILYLLKQGIDLSMGRGEKCLFWAATYNEREIVEYLLDKGLDVNGEKDKELLPNAISWGNIEIAKMLIFKGADVNKQDKEGNTALHKLSNIRDPKLIVEISQILIKAGAKVNILNNEGFSPLENAVKFHSWQAVVCLLDYGADIKLIKDEYHIRELLNITSSVKYYTIVKEIFSFAKEEKQRELLFHTCFNVAWKENDIGLLEYLIKEGLNFNIIGYPELSLLERAIREGKTETAECLLNYYPPFKSIMGGEILCKTVAEGYYELTKQLLEKGAEVDFINQYKKTPLTIAIENGNIAMVELLLKYKANIHILMQELFIGIRLNKTLLHLATEKGFIDIMLLLVEAGESVNVTDEAGRTPLHYAAEQGKIEAIKILVDNGANINPPSNPEYLEGSYTPLQKAILNGHPESAEFLLEKGAISDGKALKLAIVKDCSFNFIENLIEKGANVNDSYGSTALSMAASKGNNEVFQLLLSKGADPYIEDAQGRTSMHHAIVGGNQFIIDCLLERGFNYDMIDYNGNTPKHYALYFNKLDSLNTTPLANFDSKKYEEIKNILIKEPEYTINGIFINTQIAILSLGESSYKLSVLFNTVDEVEQYITTYRNPNSYQQIHELSIFDIPSEGFWDKSAWAQLALKYGFELTKFFAFAPRIEKRLGHPPIDLEELKETVQHIGYSRGKENIELANIFSAQAIPEIIFNKILDKHKIKDVDYLPDIYVDGKEFNQPKYYMKKLPATDLRGYILGKMTRCCQYVGQAGGSCAIHGMLSAYGGFYVVFKRPNNIQSLQQLYQHFQKCESIEEIVNPKIMTEKSQRNKYIKLISYYGKKFEELNNTTDETIKFRYIIETLSKKLSEEMEGELVAQSWAWLSEQGNLVFDSWEDLREEDDRLCEPFISSAAELAISMGINKVFLGKGGLTPKTLPFFKVNSPESPRDYMGYRDSEQQYLVNSQAIQKFLSKECEGSINKDEVGLIISKFIDLLNNKHKSLNIDKSKEITVCNHDFTFNELNDYLQSFMSGKQITYVSAKGGFGLKAIQSDLKQSLSPLQVTELSYSIGS
ncbi:hypothetical protein NF27_AZ00030 [Candidatus Jidaibacter acanthamoeba]|uniref:Uncharacterized protein n=1 Tax=Candidatus Jidaibacter acanthamoebae TaxID=86105 RepID=A0A0C1QQR6_9RICK|nr:ankyrin repeat domain-containing protein [Candidatus Jidaibacter acanthamoeba]KIE06233.1 hypothetical protein NF27_AZ00030 [Candidatus Jidaibacter acanthamoeba]